MTKLLLITVLALSLSAPTLANVLGMETGLTSLETVYIGDLDNVGELSGASAGGEGPSRVCGAVGYSYRMGKYEVTAAQYCEFLNQKAKSNKYGLFSSFMWDSSDGCKIQQSGSYGNYTYIVAADYANRPVNYVSYWSACRFANWINNGQGDSDTETGAYTLNGYTGNDGRTIQRNTGAKWFLPSEDEWYKSAYYKGGGTDAGYWEYPTQSDIPPSNRVFPVDPGNSANYYRDTYGIGNPYYRTNVGEYENSSSAYGTYDQGGNVWEWNECTFYQDPYSSRGVRGGSFEYYFAGWLRASYRDTGNNPANGRGDIGFRIAAYQSVPEPSGLIVAIFGLAGVINIRLRDARRF